MSKWATDIPDYAIKLARDFWPGPMTLILKRSDIAKDFVTGGQENVGLRVPSHPLVIALLAEFESLGGQGVAAPSANRFGAVSPTSALAVQEELGIHLTKNDLILDGGRCKIGLESTIIDCTGEIPIILRPGAVTIEMIKQLTNLIVKQDTLFNLIRTSGMLVNHYSPKAQVTLNQNAKAGEGFIALKNILTPEGAIRLASPRNTDEFAHDLYEALRNGDRQQLSKIKIIVPEGDGLISAISDRLTKAASKA
jgi:L-threonylcarbamoyladenylate synthase